MRVESRFLELLARKSRLERRKISRQTVADETGVSVGSVENWAANRVSRWDSKQIIAFCEYFGCRIDELLVIVEDDSDAGEAEAETNTPLAVAV